jgi:hypothetical protein
MGSPVTYTATVRNRGNETWVGAVQGAWQWDDTLVAEPEFGGPLAPGAVTTFAMVHVWDGASHAVRFSLKPGDDRAQNNSLNIDTKSVPFLSYIDQSYYENFRATTAGYPNARTDDLIDWINLHMARFNAMFADAGCAKRVHYDVLEVVPDAASDPAIDRQPFAVFPFRFRAAEVPSTYRQSGFYSRAEDIDYGYLHEMAHQLGLIDVYPLDLAPSANQVSGLGYSAVGCLMRGCSPFLSPHSALAMDHWRDVAHGYFGQYLYGLPATVALRFLSLNGEPLRGANVSVYQMCDRPGIGKILTPQVKAQGATDNDGVLGLPNVPIDPVKVPALPTGDVLRDNPFGYVAVIGNNGVLHLRVEYEGSVEYAWFDITEANVAYYRGRTNRAVFERRLALGGPVQRFPPADLAEGNASDCVAWAEGGAAGASFTADDRVRKFVGDTSLHFVTDGGFDTYVRYPGPFKARWDLAPVTNLSFWCYAVNNHIGFQNGSPWIRLKDSEGRYVQYQYYENGQPMDLLNNARNVWRLFSIPLGASTNAISGWRRTLFGTPDLYRIESQEIHADTWDSGFALWLDGVRFAPSLRPTASLVLESGTVVMSWAASYPPLLLKSPSEASGICLPLAYTPVVAGDVISVVLPISDQRRFLRLRVP